MALWPNRLGSWTGFKTKPFLCNPPNSQNTFGANWTLPSRWRAKGEQERRSRHWGSADEYQRQWEDVMAGSETPVAAGQEGQCAALYNRQ
jgi:hypothetical protein